MSFAPRDHTLVGAATLIGLVLLWQAGASLGLIHSLFLPSPVTIATALYDLTISGELLAASVGLIGATGDRLDD